MGAVNTTTIEESLSKAGPVMMAAFIVSIYVSTALAIILSALLGMMWLISGQYKVLPKILRHSTVPVWSAALFLCFVIGLTYGDTPVDEAVSMLSKYRELLFIPLLSCFFVNERTRRLAWIAFVTASVFTLLSSYLMEMGFLGKLARHGSFSLKSRITHSIVIAFFIFYCAHKISNAKTYRTWYALLFIIGLINLFFVVQGRTGQLVFLVLIGLFGLQRLNKRGMLAVSVVAIVFLLVFFNFSDKSSRIRRGLTDTATYFQQHEVKKQTDIMVRYEYWRNAMTLFAEKPWFGHGTGGFGTGYNRVSGARSNLQNPHNEFLMMAVQFGFAGLAVYLGFIYSFYTNAKKLSDRDKWLAQGLLTTLVVTSFFNSPFLDHAEGHWFSTMAALLYAPDFSGNLIENNE